MLAISGLSTIIDRYRAVVTDQYGVLHDGERVFDGARDVLTRLAARGVPVVTLTNSGKRAATNANRLSRMGLTPELVGTVVSSGELARVHLKQLSAGTKVALISRDAETELVDALDLKLVNPGDGKIPDLLVLAGIRPETTTQEGYASLLAPFAKAQVPMLLVNPDTLMGQGERVFFGAGAVAADYAKLGGPVTPLGKPARAMFNAALATLDYPNPTEVLMIGDSPDHDISGAKAAGFGTLLVRGGVQSHLQGGLADYSLDHLKW